MKPILKIILVLLLMLAVLVDTIYNYVTGSSEFGHFFITITVMGQPFVSMLDPLV